MQDGIEEGSLGVPMSRINNSSRRDDPLESMRGGLSIPRVTDHS